MTRKTQIGLLTAASVVCCVGVFLGARLSGKPHTATDAVKTAVTETIPPNPTPIQVGTSETQKTTEMPTILTRIEEPLSAPPDLVPTPSLDQTKLKPGAENLPSSPDAGSRTGEPLPPLSPNASASTPAALPEITLIRADLPAAADEESKLPPVPDKEPAKKPSTANAIDLPPPPPPSASVPMPTVSGGLKATIPPLEDPSPAPMKPVLPPPKELTEKAPRATPPVGSLPEPPPAIDSAPQDSRPRTAVPSPSVPESPFRSTADAKPMDVAEPVAPAAKATRESTAPPARNVPVSPTTTVGVPLTPVLKKPVVVKAKALPFTGTHSCKLDDRNGVTLPKAVRDQMGEQETLFVTLGSDHCVWLTTAAGLEKLTDRMEKSPTVEDEAKVARRRYFAQTDRVAVDKSGYVAVPAALLESAGVKQDAVLIGVGDHLELWDAQRWRKYSQTQGAETEGGATDSHEEL